MNEALDARRAAAIRQEGEYAAAHFAQFGVTKASLFALLDRYANAFDAVGDVILPTPSGPVKAACKKGCWLCCHTKILLTAPEAFYLADFIERTRGPEGFALVKADVAAADAKTRGLTDGKRWGFGPPCPLLDLKEGACSVYSARPLACRGAYSSSLESCKTAFAERETNPRALGHAPFIFQNADIFIYALAIGLKRAGRTLVKLELNAALTTIFSTERAFERWLAGEDIFKDARAPGDGGPLL